MNMSKIRKAQAILREFHELNPDMTVGTAMTLLEAAFNKGVSGRDIEVLLDVSASSASRYLRLWGEVSRNGKNGMGMLETRFDPLDHRAKVRVLTPKGSAFLEKIIAHV